MTAEAKPSRFGENHTPPPDYALDRLNGAFQARVIRKLLTYGNAVGLDPDNILQHLVTQYPEKSLRELSAATGISRHTINDLLDFVGTTRLTAGEFVQRNIAQGIGIFGMTEEEKIAHNIAAGKRAKELGTGIHAQTIDERRELGRQAGNQSLSLGVGVHNLTHEELRAAGKKGGTIGGKVAKDKGVGIHALTTEQRKKIGSEVSRRINKKTGESNAISSGKRIHALGVGIFARTHEQHLADGLRASEALSSRKIIVESDYFDSYLEAATAILLEQFVPEYRVQRGVNYQVILESAGIKVDFLVGDVLVEYNPIVLKYLPRVTGFDTQEEYELYTENLSQLDEDQQAQYSEQVLQGIAQRYYQRRRNAINQDPEFRDRELIVTTTPGDLYDQVITRFGQDYPNRDEFVGSFNSTRRTIRNENRRRRRSENQEAT